MHPTYSSLSSGTEARRSEGSVDVVLSSICPAHTDPSLRPMLAQRPSLRTTRTSINCNCAWNENATRLLFCFNCNRNAQTGQLLQYHCPDTIANLTCRLIRSLLFLAWSCRKPHYHNGVSYRGCWGMKKTLPFGLYGSSNTASAGRK